MTHDHVIDPPTAEEICLIGGIMLGASGAEKEMALRAIRRHVAEKTAVLRREGLRQMEGWIAEREQVRLLREILVRHKERNEMVHNYPVLKEALSREGYKLYLDTCAVLSASAL